MDAQELIDETTKEITKERKVTIISSYIFKYGFFICLIVIGITVCFIFLGLTLMLTPTNPSEYPKWFFLIVGSTFFMIGCSLLFMAIKYSLLRYLYE